MQIGIVPEDSRTLVQHTTCVSLTAGFGNRPFVSHLWRNYGTSGYAHRYHIYYLCLRNAN